MKGNESIMITIQQQTCGQCGLCPGVCPVQALALHAWGLEVDDKKCTGCGQCVTVCPTGALTSPLPSPNALGEGARERSKGGK
jgi:ferredoxin